MYIPIVLCFVFATLTNSYKFPYHPTECGVSISLEQWNGLSPDPDKYNLIQANVFIRHGDRMPWQPAKCFDGVTWQCNLTFTTFPSSLNNGPQTQAYQIVNNNETEVNRGNCMVGQLTETGFQQHSRLGEQLWYRYNDFYSLPQICGTNPPKYILRSDNSPRVQASAMTLFDRFCSGTSADKSTTPITFHSQDETTDIIKPNPIVCPVLDVYEQKTLNSAEYQKYLKTVALPLLEKLQPLFKYSNLTSDPSGVLGSAMAFDCATTHICHGKDIPSEITPQVYADLSIVTKDLTTFLDSGPDLSATRKVTVGPIVDILLRRMKKAVAEPKNVETVFSLTGGHDTGPQIPLLLAWNQKLDRWVPYATMITVELFQKKTNGEMFVFVSHDGKPLTGVTGVDNTTTLYSWSEFEAAMNEMIPSRDECPGYYNPKRSRSLRTVMV